MSYTTTNKVPGLTWEEREQNILKTYKPLVITNYTLTEFDDCLEDFIHNFLVSYNYKYSTAYIDRRGDKQCTAGRLRSLIDIFLICKYYFPDCTLKQVKDALYANFNVLSYRICSTVKRRVYWITLNSIGRSGSTSFDEFNLTEINYKTT